MEKFGFANFLYEGGQFGEKILVFSSKNKNLNLKIKPEYYATYFNSSQTETLNRRDHGVRPFMYYRLISE